MYSEYYSVGIQIFNPQTIEGYLSYNVVSLMVSKICLDSYQIVSYAQQYLRHHTHVLVLYKGICVTCSAVSESNLKGCCTVVYLAANVLFHF